MNNGKSLKYIRPLWLLIIAALFITFFSCSTSPLMYGNPSYDSSFFILVGKGMKEGLMPYRDFFDMKGPYIFFIQYIGQCICEGRTGAYLMQIVSFFISLVFFDKAYRLVIKKESIITETLLLTGAVLFAAGTLTDGNLTEEYSLPFLSVSLYMILKYFRECDLNGGLVPHSRLYTFFYGLTFGVIALMRITNAALIGAILLTMTVVLIADKKFAELFGNALAFLAGVAAAVVPVLVYFKCIGLLDEMLQAVFGFGFTYSSERTVMEVMAQFDASQWLVFLAPAMPVAALIVLKIKDLKYRLFSVSNAVLIFAAYVMGNGYYHYLTLALPNIVLAFWLLADKYEMKAKKERIAAIAVLVIMLAVPMRGGLVNIRRDAYHIAKTFISEPWVYSEKVSASIPEDEKDSVYCYFTYDSTWYLNTGIYPCIKYCDWQNHYVKLSPEIRDGLAATFENNPPKWLVVLKKPTAEYPEFLVDALENDYELNCEDGKYMLYGLIR